MNMNLSAGASYTVPRGFPVRLLVAGDLSLSGIVPKGIATVVASVQTEAGTANAHMALYTMPTTSGGNDGALVSGTQVDIIGLTTTAQTMTVTVPTTGAPACYVVRIWADSIKGSNAETISRDGSTLAANLPKIPVAVKVASVTVT